jgi:hypothetical protein
LIGAFFDRIYEIYQIYSQPDIENCDNPRVTDMAKNIMAKEITKNAYMFFSIIGIHKVLEVTTHDFFTTTGIVDPSTVKTLASPGDPDLPPGVLYSCSVKMTFRTGRGDTFSKIVMYLVEKDEKGDSYVRAGFWESEEDAPAKETPSGESPPVEETPSPNSTTGEPAVEAPSPSTEIVEPADEVSDSSVEMPLETKTPNKLKSCSMPAMDAARSGGAFTYQVSAGFVAETLSKSGSWRNRNRKK